MSGTFDWGIPPKWDWAKTGRLVLWVGVAFTVGLGAGITQVAEDSGLNLTRATVIAVLYAAVRIGMKFLKTYGPVEFGFLTRFLCLALCSALGAGCATGPWYSSPMKSHGKVEFHEVVKDDEIVETKLVFLGDGEGKFAQNLKYKGAGKDAWELVVAEELDITSKALTITAQGYADFYRIAGNRLPDLTEALSIVPTTDIGGGLTLRDMIFEMVVKNPQSIDSVIGWLGGLAGLFAPG